MKDKDGGKKRPRIEPVDPAPPLIRRTRLSRTPAASRVMTVYFRNDADHLLQAVRRRAQELSCSISDIVIDALLVYFRESERKTQRPRPKNIR